MHQNLLAFLIAAGAVTLAEMGDKTQLLAMAFATKFKPFKVMVGVFIATILNHGLAVALGSFVARYESINLWIQIIASLSFIFFGLWTIKGDKLEGEYKRSSRFGAVATVAVAFFIAELGDKTQLATIALSAKYAQSPLFVLLGTTTGMLIADGFGIVVGIVLCKKIPEKTVKLISAAAFVLFGFIGSFQVMHNTFKLEIWLIALILTAIAVVTFFIAYKLIKSNEYNTSDEPSESEIISTKIKIENK